MEFKNYREQKPEVAGTYIWTVNHNSIENLAIEFFADFRWRGAGYQNVLSPEFDYWDGYNVLLPKGMIAWAEYSGEKVKNGCEIIDIPGVENIPCPFCGKVPAWKYSGRFIGAGPVDAKYFYLECCHWFNGFGSSMANPIELSKKRNEAIKSARG